MAQLCAASCSDCDPTAADMYVMEGHNIIAEVLAELSDNNGLQQAADLILSGCSAGGIGVFKNADYVTSTLPNVRVVANPQAGYFGTAFLPYPEFSELDGRCAAGQDCLSMVDATASVATSWTSQLTQFQSPAEDACAAAYTGPPPPPCADQETGPAWDALVAGAAAAGMAGISSCSQLQIFCDNAQFGPAVQPLCPVTCSSCGPVTSPCTGSIPLYYPYIATPTFVSEMTTDGYQMSAMGQLSGDATSSPTGLEYVKYLSYLIGSSLDRNVRGGDHRARDGLWAPACTLHCMPWNVNSPTVGGLLHYEVRLRHKYCAMPSTPTVA